MINWTGYQTHYCLSYCVILLFLLLSSRLFVQSWSDVNVDIAALLHQPKQTKSEHKKNVHYEFIGWVQECHFLSNISKFWLFTSYSAPTQSWWCFLCFLIFIYLFDSLYFAFTHRFFYLPAWSCMGFSAHLSSLLPIFVLFTSAMTQPLDLQCLRDVWYHQRLSLWWW